MNDKGIDPLGIPLFISIEVEHNYALITTLYFPTHNRFFSPIYHFTRYEPSIYATVYSEIIYRKPFGIAGSPASI